MRIMYNGSQLVYFSQISLIAYPVYFTVGCLASFDLAVSCPQKHPIFLFLLNQSLRKESLVRRGQMLIYIHGTVRCLYYVDVAQAELRLSGLADEFRLLIS